MTAFQSLRWRLTLAFLGSAAALLAAAGFGAAFLVERVVWAPFDASLVEEAETLTAIRDSGRGDLQGTVESVGREHDPGPDKFVLVGTIDGETEAQFGVLPAGIDRADSRGQRLFSLRTGRGRYRVASFASPAGGRCVIGARAERQARLIARARVAIGSSAALLLMLFGGLARAVTTRAVHELERLSRELETIEAGSLDRRLEPRRTTEVARLATVLNRLLSRLESAMASLQRFTADAAHELRTPVTALRTHLEVALTRPDDLEALREGVIDGLEQTERLARLAEDLLTLATVEADRGKAAVEPVALDAVTEDVCASLEPIAQEQKRRFSRRLEANVRVHGVPSLLRRLLVNLIDNAFRHTPPEADVEVVVSGSAGEARVEVRDRGGGIDSEELPRVFERFHRGSSGAGSGLGLAICHEIVKSHQGGLSIRSDKVSGTTVLVTLPLAHS